MNQNPFFHKIKKSLDLQLTLKTNTLFNILSQFLLKIKDWLLHQQKLGMTFQSSTINTFQFNSKVVNLVVAAMEKSQLAILLICTNTEKKNQKINGIKKNLSTNGQMLSKNSVLNTDLRLSIPVC